MTSPSISGTTSAPQPKRVDTLAAGGAAGTSMAGNDTGYSDRGGRLKGMREQELGREAAPSAPMADSGMGPAAGSGMSTDPDRRPLAARGVSPDRTTPSTRNAVGASSNHPATTSPSEAASSPTASTTSNSAPARCTTICITHHTLVGGGADPPGMVAASSAAALMSRTWASALRSADSRSKPIAVLDRT